MLERMWGVKMSVIPGVIAALGAVTTRLGKQLQKIPPLPRTAKPLGLWQRTTLEERRGHQYFFLHCSLSSSDELKYLSHFRNCHVSLYAAVHVLLSSHFGFLLCHTHVCLRLIILFNSSLSLLEWYSVTAASPVVFVLTWQPFLSASVLRQAQTIIFLITSLPGTNREASNGTWQLSTQLAAITAWKKQVSFLIFFPIHTDIALELVLSSELGQGSIWGLRAIWLLQWCWWGWLSLDPTTSADLLNI